MTTGLRCSATYNNCITAHHVCLAQETRAALGVAALLIAMRALERRDPNDDRPSSVR